MFSVPTVFVIGAGAGQDIKMPVGSVLSDVIAEKLNFHFTHGSLDAGDPNIMQAISQIAQKQSANPNDWIAAGRSVTKGIKYTRSIDSYISAHRDDTKIRDLAKLAIVRSILESERELAIRIEPDGSWHDDEKTMGSWFRVLMFLLQDRIVKGKNLNDLFANFTIINFNYDRCVTQYLFHAVQQLYRLDDGDAAAVMNSWKMLYHPYGSVGVLPWQNGSRRVDFGGSGYGDISGLSQEIFTYDEQVSDGTALADIRSALENARRVVFLGFHFHRQNMELIQSGRSGGLVHVYATVPNRSEAEIGIIREQIKTLLGGGDQCRIEPIGAGCKALLDTFGTTLLK